MKLLLDTHILLWWVINGRALSARAKAAISDANAIVFVSAASVWEIAIKRRLGKLEFPVEKMADILGSRGFTSLAVTLDHAVRAGALPMHHHDPVDRMLIAQAQLEGLTIVTLDKMFSRYQVAILGD